MRRARAQSVLLSIVVSGLVMGACGSAGPDGADPGVAAGIDESAKVAAPHFVGRESCARCHPTELRAWEGSHHDLAMQEADATTVLGDFEDATFTQGGVTSTFFKRDGRFFVNTDGADGEMRDYEVAYTFGAVPLQQYLIGFPDGRYQVLSLCWDTRRAGVGGQRWFHLYPDETIDHDDPLHWTAISQNWNHMCAECHSTRLEKKYVAAEDRFETSWEEIDVSCEACHGPASDHLAWAEAVALGDPAEDVEHMGLAVRLTDPGRGTWMFSPETGNGMRLEPAVATAELETCARCHSRRGQVAEHYEFGRPLLDTHRLALLDEPLYHADGQILDEVYVYGSFLQSRMHAQGVTCSDCHDPHSGTLLFRGNDVCARCHQAARYDTREHHFHPVQVEDGEAVGGQADGTACVDCHMPPRTYMVVDPRHDHSLRIPRPDLSAKLGTPNACNDCHQDRSVRWAAAKVAEWYGPERRAERRYGETLFAGRTGGAAAESDLTVLIDDLEAAGIVRASALALLPRYLSGRSLPTVQGALLDDDPLVRYAAVRTTESIAPEARVGLVSPLLSDPVRVVRLEAARVLAAAPPETMSDDQRASLVAALDEFEQAQLIHLDRPEAHLSLGWLHVVRGEMGEAETAHLRALELAPHEPAIYINLADLYRSQQRDTEGEGLLRRGLEAAPESADVHHSLGLLLIRRGKQDEALDELREAARLRPEEPRYSYVYAIALNARGETEQALDVLRVARELHPADRSLLAALMTISLETGYLGPARRYARELVRLSPGDPVAREVLKRLGS